MGTNLTGGSEWTWIGGYQDDADEWNWTDGSEWTGFNPWGPGQPDNLWGKDDHLGINYPRAGEWNDFNGDYPQGSICQYDPFQTAATFCYPVGNQCYDPEIGGFENAECCDGFCDINSPYEPGYCSFASTDTPTSCEPGWSYLEHTGLCYKYDPTNRTWSEALMSCYSPNPTSTLASVLDNATNSFLTNLTGGSEWTWIGGYQDDADEWNW